MTTYLYFGNLVALTGYDNINFEYAIAYEDLNRQYKPCYINAILQWHGLDRV